MADERKYFVICADNCKFESMTKEQILTAIAQAISTGKITDVDTGFVTSIKEQNSGAAFKVWIGTQAEFLEQKESIPANTFCIFTDDTTAEEINDAIAELKEAVSVLEKALQEKPTNDVIYNGDPVSSIVLQEPLPDFSHYKYIEITAEDYDGQYKTIQARLDYIESGVTYFLASGGVYPHIEMTVDFMGLDSEANTLYVKRVNEDGERFDYPVIKIVGYKGA